MAEQTWADLVLYYLSAIAGNEKIMFTPEGGLAIRLINKTGGAL